VVLAPQQLHPLRRKLLDDPEEAVLLLEGAAQGAGLRWWSTIESSWINWTLFDRAAGALTLTQVAELRIDDAVVRDGAGLLGLS